mmetsp:Transcript_36987/g.82226  ORF Transcript_36987/g.82226 Transcript_36987/m.82226 type:complete len:303 (+) Transcript_36987:108-1016(+)|eukprot:CAMPEP_0202895152 /NCGR_PEP_ID=MMETSP1392-20130828/4409_1 /ASSEMBLY_ACC=CAM_ASM_000868 /TAXON_ID=225041 /ORGANISM="Chlamydomonas chlamydogama, Strain SAG 11-48b" /LENGTH=302 /DNA_ID=CAMNT_0049580067 /DNA_START=106 /DNA_END=1014 /DNA_ORIENTATION=-
MAFDAALDAQVLMKAMKGFGTDDKTLIASITSKTNEQLQLVRAEFQKQFNKDLIQEVKSETSGDYERALVGLLLSPSEFDAKICNRAMKGMGTDEDAILEVLSHRSWDEIKAIEAAYLKDYGKTLVHDLEGDLSGISKKFFVALVTNRREELAPEPATLDAVASELYAAGQMKVGTDERTFIDKITTLGPRYLAALNEQYGRRFGDTLIRAVHKEMGGIVAKGLQALLTEHDEYYADLIFKAVDGMGTNEARLIRVLCGRRSHLPAINIAYMRKYQKSLHGRVSTEVSGNLGKVLLNLVANL